MSDLSEQTAIAQASRQALAEPSCDFEFRSGTDIKDGLPRYFADAEADVICMAWTFPGAGEPGLWHPGLPVLRGLRELLDHVKAGGKVRGWNVMFEWHVWNACMVPRYGWPELRMEQLVDTMAEAAALNLPQSLGKCAAALQLPSDKQKDKRGKELIKLLCVPREEPVVKPPEAYKLVASYKAAQTRHRKWVESGGRWLNDISLLQEMYTYCQQDVVTEAAVAGRIRRLSEYEQRQWLLTQRINQRGVPLAIDEARAITRIVHREVDTLNAELEQLTGGQVSAASERAKLMAWINENGPKRRVQILTESSLRSDGFDPLPAGDTSIVLHQDGMAYQTYAERDLLEDMQAETIDALLINPDLALPRDVRRALEIRAAVSQTSTAKIDAMLRVVAADGTLKGMHVYHGAGTGRDASRGGVNLQNISRPALKVDAKKGIDEIWLAHLLLGGADYEACRLVFGDQVMTAAVACVRGLLKAPPGYIFTDADFSSVENRVGVWLADQDDKVDLFRKGLDEYKEYASKVLFRIPYDAVTKEQRQFTKPVVLGCFAAGTPVITKRGLIAIEEVSLADVVWDGFEWVPHAGVVYQGDKEVIDLAGVQLTPDHKVLSENGWERADSVDLKSALSLASGRSPATGWPVVKLSQMCAAAVAADTWSRSTCSDEAAAPDVGSAPTERRAAGAASVLETRPSSLMTPCVPPGSTGGSQPSDGAMTPRMPGMPTMADAGFTSVLSGEKTQRSSCVTSPACPVGVDWSSSLTASTTIAATNPATCASQLEQSNAPTHDERIGCFGRGVSGPQTSSGASSPQPTEAHPRLQESSVPACPPSESSPSKAPAVVPTFDILNAGPRSRFTIWTDQGPLIVHNCLFGQGAVGLVGYAAGMGVHMTLEYASEAVAGYRQEYRKVRNLWYRCGDASIDAVNNPGRWVRAGTKLKLMCHKGFLWMKLPSGRCLAWYAPRIENRKTPWGEWRDVVTVEQEDAVTKQWRRDKLIGSAIYQNGVQAVARDLLMHGCMNVEEGGYQVVLRAHDELLSNNRIGFGSLEDFLERMCDKPEWATDLPLAGEGWQGDRFRK